MPGSGDGQFRVSATARIADSDRIWLAGIGGRLTGTDHSHVDVVSAGLSVSF